MRHVLVLNAGSSSVKFGLFEGDMPRAVASGQVDRIGADAQLHLKDATGTSLARSALPTAAARDHAGALTSVLGAIREHFPSTHIAAVGHRVVHGGPEFTDPTIITPDVLDRLDDLTAFAPLHQPHNLAGIRAAFASFPKAIQVACFDTGFHRGHPFVNDVFALPRKYYDQGVRRYGFHGISYEYIAGTLAETAPDLHAGRVVIAHLGNGASMCGLRGGRSVASTMGFTALDGLAMGTRPGQLDPGVILYLMQHEGLSPDAISDLLYKHSGLLGLSGISSDMRVLLESDDPRAAEAIDYFCARIRRELGSLSAALEGIDGFVFTGGIGENATAIRAKICAGLGWLGIEIDAARNERAETLISSETSTIPVMVIPTNEERVIARAAMRLMGDA